VIVAGTGISGSNANQLNYPVGVCIDSFGNLYIADYWNNRIQKWAPGATEGVTVAGTGTAGRNANQLSYPVGVCIDSFGNLYIADYKNHRIQKWAPGATEGVTVAGTTGTSGPNANQLNFPIGLCIDSFGNLYIADIDNHRIQKWAPGATEGVTVAGTGIPGSNPNRLSQPFDVTLDASGNVYVADRNNHRVQKWAPGSTEGVTVAGTGISGSNANQLNGSVGVALDSFDNLYVTDFTNSRVQKFTNNTPQIVIPAGQTSGNLITTAVVDGIIEEDETIILTPTASGATFASNNVVNIIIQIPAPSALSYTTPNVFIKDIAITPLSPTYTGTVTSFTVSPTLPAGLSINATTGVISGTPTTITASNTYVVIAVNGTGSVMANVLIEIIAGDTDGVDGAEEIAGAIIAPDTLTRAWAAGIQPRKSLDNNDGHGFFQALGDSVITGPTLTNVNDFRAVIIDTPTGAA
jgi:sugar lactone lactonase YvrE